ncbi:translocation/assembly module TamB domain-containing protein [Pseudooceanicola sp. C21-150M6]|uniref:translocation/assembly module TamB domain-containing protein n=1 Tax=Pseudooceanicola sp. C21-150M6 TaxID=3434355 RepID=UPI003D7F4A88
MKHVFGPLLAPVLVLFLGLCVALSAASGVRAQQADDGEGYLTRLLQDTLSSAGREVDITGFRGALSSRATLDRMTVADDEGVWLELTGAVLDWNRAALLRGRVEVGELTAQSLRILRAPVSEDTSAEASGFSIPELPVSIEIGRLGIDQLILGAPILGEEAVFTFSGSASYTDQIAADLTLERQDRDGQITLKTDYDTGAETLSIDVTANEPAEGIAARLLDLPGRPALDLEISGAGPLDDFAATIRLASDGQDRLAGDVTLTGQSDGGRDFSADLGGDLTALLLPEAREFLGQNVQLTARGNSAADGALRLDQFTLDSAALRLSGALALTPEGRPASFDLTGDIADADGTPVRLPFGDQIDLTRAEIRAQFDAAVSEDVTANVLVSDLSVPDTTVQQARLALTGQIVTEGTPSVDLDVDAGLDGLSFSDPALQQAVGSDVTLTAGVIWTDGQPLTLSDLDLQGDGYGTQVDALFTRGDGTQIIDAQGRAAFEDLSRLAGLAGTDLSGRADLALTLNYDLLGGMFALQANGGTTDLALGIEELDRVIGGDATLTVDVARDEEGTRINDFALSNAQITMAADGELGNETGRIDYRAQLANSGAFTGVEGGPLSIAGTVIREDGDFRISLDGGGRDLRTGLDQVDPLLEGPVALTARASIGDRIILDMAEVSSAAMAVTAEGDLTEGARDITATGWLNQSGILTGAGRTGGAVYITARAVQSGADYDITLTGTGTDIATGQDMVDGLLRGKTQVEASARIGDRLILNSAEVRNDALTAQAEGELTEGARDVTLTARLANSGRIMGGTGGPVDVTLTAKQDGTAYDLSVDATGTNVAMGQALADSLLRGQTVIAARGRYDDGALQLDSASVDGVQLTARASGQVSADATNLDFSARVASLAVLVPQAPAGPLSASGTVRQTASGALDLNVTAEGPGGTNARIAGQVNQPGGAVALTVQGAAPLALANPYITPRSVVGMARFDLAMNGQPGLEALSGQVAIDGARAIDPESGVALENIAGTVQMAGGRANVSLSAAMNGGQLAISGPVTLSGNYPANLQAQISNVTYEMPGLASTRINGQLAVNGGLAGGGTVTGRIGLSDTELRIPSGGFGGVEAIPEMRHVNEDAASRRTRSRAGLIGEDSNSGGGGSGGLNLNLRIETDTSMFLRGRGIDAELRGGMTVQGTTSDVQPVGQFDLVRGRMSILTKRLDFTEGRVRLAGGFDPIVRLVAENSSEEYVIQIAVEGPAAQPEVIFSSRPDLPQDEVVSQLFFGRDISSLSAFQAARLAVAIAELTGKTSGGLVSQLREGAGIDDLDVSQTEDGEAALAVGKYISDNVYTEVEATSGGKTSLSINLDISSSFTAKGKVDSEGDSSLGLFFEKDY